MERLSDTAIEIINDLHTERLEYTSEYIPLIDSANKLAEYEDLEEQDLLLRLPCKVGDTVWDNDFRKPCAYEITGFSLGTSEDYIYEPVSEKEVVCYYSNYGGSITGSFAVSEIGKTVFLTKEEAEAKLNELEGSKEE